MIPFHSQIKPVRNIQLHFCKLHFKEIFTLGPTVFKRLPSFIFTRQNSLSLSLHISPLLHACYMDCLPWWVTSRVLLLPPFLVPNVFLSTECVPFVLKSQNKFPSLSLCLTHTHHIHMCVCVCMCVDTYITTCKIIVLGLLYVFVYQIGNTENSSSNDIIPRI